MLGIINFKSKEIVSYFLLIGGISLFYYSFLKENKTGVFFGSALFLTGIFLFTISHFEILSPDKLLIPSLLIIIAVGLLLGHYLISKDKFTIILSITFLIIGTTLLILRSNATFKSYLYAMFEFLEMYWIIILISAGIVFLISKEIKKELK